MNTLSEIDKMVLKSVIYFTRDLNSAVRHFRLDVLTVSVNEHFISCIDNSNVYILPGTHYGQPCSSDSSLMSKNPLVVDYTITKLNEAREYKRLIDATKVFTAIDEKISGHDKIVTELEFEKIIENKLDQ